jgi:hypothetical protein
MVAGMSRDELVSGVVRIGELEVSGEDQAEIDAYFAPGFRFHGPDGRELDYAGLQAYGRLAEEWIQNDSRSVLRQLGAEGR